MMRLFLLTVLVFSLLVTQVYALGIATDYGSEVVNIPITQKTAYWSFRLQNMENKEMPVMIFVFSEVARLMNETTYTLKPNTTGVEFLVEINLPKHAGIGNRYDVNVDVRQMSNGDGQLVLGQGIGKTFTVVVADPNKPKYDPLERGSGTTVDGSADYTWLLYTVGLGLPVVLISAGYLWYRKKKNQMLRRQYQYGY